MQRCSRGQIIRQHDARQQARRSEAAQRSKREAAEAAAARLVLGFLRPRSPAWLQSGQAPRAKRRGSGGRRSRAPCRVGGLL